jgi:hypothetical protein
VPRSNGFDVNYEILGQFYTLSQLLYFYLALFAYFFNINLVLYKLSVYIKILVYF